MTKSKTPYILFLSVLVFILTALAAPMAFAQSDNSGVISGTAWVDANDNGIQEPSEEVASGVTIEVRNSEHSMVGTVITDESGFYILTDLAHGVYSVNGVEDDGALTPAQTVELNEINGAALVNVPVKAAIMKRLFLPLVRR